MVPQSKGSQRVHSMRDRSFQVNGVRIFNSLRKSVRNLTRTSIDDFKSKLNKYLETLPDEPKLTNYISSSV